MTDVHIIFDDYYINQGDSNFKNITFKNGTTVGSYGCGVCCAAMIICKNKGLTSSADKIKVIKQVIENSTDDKGRLDYRTITYGGTQFKWSTTTDMADQLTKGYPTICQLPGHYVLVNGYDTSKSGNQAYLIEDPGKAANTNLSQPMATYGTTISSKRLLKG